MGNLLSFQEKPMTIALKNWKRQVCENPHKESYELTFEDTGKMLRDLLSGEGFEVTQIVHGEERTLQDGILIKSVPFTRYIFCKENPLRPRSTFYQCDYVLRM